MHHPTHRFNGVTRARVLPRKSGIFMPFLMHNPNGRLGVAMRGVKKIPDSREK